MEHLTLRNTRLSGISLLPSLFLLSPKTVVYLANVALETDCYTLYQMQASKSLNASAVRPHSRIAGRP